MRNGFTATVERLEQSIDDEGLTLLSTIDHAANARSAGLELPPTTVQLFGNPQAGTPLMRAAPTIALDLQQRMLVWQDEGSEVFEQIRIPSRPTRPRALPGGLRRHRALRRTGQPHGLQ